MSDTTVVEVTPEPLPEDVTPVVADAPKTPLWKNRRVLKTAGIVAATAAATAVIISKVRSSGSEELVVDSDDSTDETPDTIDIVID